MNLPKNYRRDEFSGHILIQHPTMPEYTVELYPGANCGWNIEDIQFHSVSAVKHLKLHIRSNIVYPFWRKQVIPHFIHIREALAWMEYVDGNRALESI